jgi:type I restriction enzyme R subunit
MSGFTKSIVKQAALAWLESAGWQVRNGTDVAPGELAAERDDYGQVVLVQWLRDALARLNPLLPFKALDASFRKLTRPEDAGLISHERALQCRQVDGVAVAYCEAGGDVGSSARGRDRETRTALMA